MAAPGEKLVVGVDVGGTKVRVAVATRDGDVLGESEAPTELAGGADLADQVATMVVEVAGGRWADVAGVGVGAPGALDPATGRIAYSQNIPGMDAIDLPGLLRSRLDRPVEVANDVNLAAMGEHWAGHGRGCDDLVVVAVGTGIGAGIISGGRLLVGHRGAAGEIAELPLLGDPADPDHRRQGVFESQAATAAMVRRYTAVTGRPVQGGAREVLTAAAGGDTTAAAVVDEVAGGVALGIVVLVAVLDPELVVLAGGIGAHPRFAAAVAAALPRVVDDPPRLEVSALGERASLVGAIRLAAIASGHG